MNIAENCQNWEKSQEEEEQQSKVKDLSIYSRSKICWQTHCLGRYIKENEMICGKDYDFMKIYILDNCFMQKKKCFDDVFWRNHHLKTLHYAKNPSF